MKRSLAALALAIALAAPQVACASENCCGDKYDDSQSNPLRLIAYAIHPVGYAIKWAIVWPIHCLVSQPGVEEMFGHRPHTDYTFDEDYL